MMRLKTSRLPLLAAASLLGAAACGGDTSGPPAPPPVATVTVTPDSSSVARGASLQLTATTRDADGTVLTGREVSWSTDDAERATVTDFGRITAVSAGRVVVTASSEGRSGSAVIVVEGSQLDFSIDHAHFTQGVQAADAGIPIVLGWNAAVVNVLLRATPESSAATPVELRIVDLATEALVHADTALTSGRLGGAPDYSMPSAQFLVPASVLRSGLGWRVRRDPQGGMGDDSLANDVYPRTGYAALTTVDAPTLSIRFVPIVLAANGGATGGVTDATLPQYLRTVRRILPLGRIEARTGAPFTTSASFGTAPRGGERDFWVRLLSELDLARIADPEPYAHWYGVVRPPPGFNFTEYGGFAYIPASGADVGPNSRTALGVQIGWFNRQGQAEDLVAHELGHNFGRRHAPCGGAGSPLDGDYPVPGGTLDVPGHDVHSWMTGAASAAATVPKVTGDVMGYCFPVWSSAYTYAGILGFRSVAAAALPPVATVTVVRGHVIGGDVELEPAFTIEARPTPSRHGAWRLEGLAADGTVLFTETFEPARLDHAPDVRSFTIAVRTTPQTRRELHRLRVRGPAGEAMLTRPMRARLPQTAAAQEALVEREGAGMARVTCADGTRGVLVREPGGAVLGTSRGSAAVIVAPAGAAIEIACSDGVGTERYSAIVP